MHQCLLQGAGKAAEALLALAAVMAARACWSRWQGPVAPPARPYKFGPSSDTTYGSLVAPTELRAPAKLKDSATLPMAPWSGRFVT